MDDLNYCIDDRCTIRHKHAAHPHGELLADAIRPPPRVESIIREACRWYDVAPAEFYSRYRTRSVAKARWAVFYILYHLMGRSCVEIARTTGRHHTTILNGAEQVAADDKLLREAETIAWRAGYEEDQVS